MKAGWLRAGAASMLALILAAAALPAQAAAATPSPGCAQAQALARRHPQLVQAYPDLARTLAGCAGAAGSMPSPGFGDLGGYAWARADIDLMQAAGIMQGVGGGRFLPGGALTRAELALLLQRVFHLSPPARPTAFVDVGPTYWARDAIAAAAPFMGRFATPAGLAFEPGLPALRIDVAAAIGRIETAEGMAQLPSTAAAGHIWAGLSDGSLVPAALRQYAAVALQSQVMLGYGDGAFGVDATLSRAAAAVLLARVLQGTASMPAGTDAIRATSSMVGTLASVTASALSLTVGGARQSLPAAPGGPAVSIDGRSGSLGTLTAGQTAAVTLNARGQVVAVAATDPGTAIATLAGTLSSAGGSRLALAVGGAALALAVAPGTSATLNGQPAALADLPAGAAASLSVDAGGRVVALAATTAAATVTGTIASVAADALAIRVDGAVRTYVLAPGATLTRNGQAVTLAALAPGDAVRATLNGRGEIRTLAATGAAAANALAGTVKGVDAYALVLDVAGVARSLPLAAGVNVTLNGQTVALAAVVPGDGARATLDSAGRVVGIALSTATAAITGTVVSVAASTPSYAILLKVAGSVHSYAVLPGTPVTIGGVAGSLGELVAGETATLTLSTVIGQVTAISAAVTTIRGYVVDRSAASVSLAVYGSGGATTLPVAAGAKVVVNGMSASAGELPLGASAAVGTGAGGAGGAATTIAAATPVNQVRGTLVTAAGSAATLIVNGTAATVALGPAPLAFAGGSPVALGALRPGQAVTIDPAAVDGSALLVQ